MFTPSHSHGRRGGRGGFNRLFSTAYEEFDAPPPPPPPPFPPHPPWGSAAPDGGEEDLEEGEDFGPPGPGRRGRRGFGPGGPRFGPPGFVPGPPHFGPPPFGPAPGFGPGFVMRGFGPGRGGHEGRRGGRGGRGRRGNVRAAVLALLAEEPRHGYAIMNELAERSGGLWRPSPGSVYPVLQQLQDEGLVAVEESEGRRVFSLTETGRSYVTEHAEELHEPWQVAESGPRQRVQSIMFAVQSLGVAADQVARLADDPQTEQAVAAIENARRALYRILAGEPVEPGAAATGPATPAAGAGPGAEPPNPQ